MYLMKRKLKDYNIAGAHQQENAQFPRQLDIECEMPLMTSLKTKGQTLEGSFLCVALRGLATACSFLAHATGAKSTDTGRELLCPILFIAH